MVRFDIKPTKGTTYEHTQRVYGAMFAEHGSIPESVTLYDGGISHWNVNGLVRMVQIVEECAIHIDCDDGTVHIQRFNDGSVQIDGGTDWFKVEVVE